MSSEFELIYNKGEGFRKESLHAPPSLGPRDVLARPKWVGICGSDLYYMQVSDVDLRLGHEWVGVVERVGSDVRGLRAGDLVSSTGTIACFHCGPCHDERTNLCDSAIYLSSDKMGALRSWLLLSEDHLTRVSGPLRRELVLHELIAVAESAMQLLNVHMDPPQKRDELLILGCGPVGFAVAQVARDLGWQPLIVDKLESRVRAAKQRELQAVPFAQAVIDPRYAGRFASIVDASHDYYGGSGAFRSIPIFAAKGFTALVVGKYIQPQSVPSSYNSLGGKLVWMRGMPDKALRASVAKWDTRLEELVPGFITHEFPVEEADQAFALAALKEESMKVVLAIS